MLDETIVTEVPPLYACYGHIGEQVQVPITGTHAKRILHGVINIWTGEVLLLITQEWVQETHQYFLQMIRAKWRGWQIVLFEDLGAPHTAEASLDLARELGIGVRFLPKATPKLNAMDQLWRRVKGRMVASRPTHSIEELADHVCQYILDLSPQQRLQQAGLLSGNFWLRH